MTTKKKLAILAAGPVAAIALFGATFASAHGMFGMFGQQATPDQIASAQTTMFQQHANLLGVNVDEVKSAWAQGKTLKQLAAEKGITQEQLQQKMKDLRLQQIKANLQALVDKGVITQSQADQRLQFMQTQGQNGKIKGFNRGGHGMMGM